MEMPSKIKCKRQKRRFMDVMSGNKQVVGMIKEEDGREEKNCILACQTTASLR